jgi:RNA polymerase sigma-70 factor (ECF subfamily)
MKAMTSKQPSETADALERRILEEVPRLRAFLRKLARDEAEDLLQEALERVLRYRSAFDPEGSLRGWLQKTAFRVYLDHRGRRSRSPEPLGERADRLIGGASASQLEAREEVERLLSGLSAPEREVILRFHRDERSIDEIAKDLGMPGGTVKSHLHRARRKIARRGSGRRDA